MMPGQASAPPTAEIFSVSRSDLVEAIEAELKEYFDDGISLTVGQHAIDHIIGGMLHRLQSKDHHSARKDSNK